jgi:hypothetical protein
MESPSRRLLIICTAVSGICIVGEFVLAIYALDHSPGVLDIAFYEDGGIVRRQAKDAVLLAPIYMQTMFFFVLVYASIGWKRFIRRGIDRTAETHAKYSRDINLAYGLRLTCYGVLVMDAFILAIVCHYSFQILNV